MKMFKGKIDWLDSYKLVVGEAEFYVEDENKNCIYFEKNNYWNKHKYNEENKEVYFESSYGTVIKNQTKPIHEMNIQELQQAIEESE